MALPINATALWHLVDWYWCNEEPISVSMERCCGCDNTKAMKVKTMDFDVSLTSSEAPPLPFDSNLICFLQRSVKPLKLRNHSDPTSRRDTFIMRSRNRSVGSIALSCEYCMQKYSLGNTYHVRVNKDAVKLRHLWQRCAVVFASVSHYAEIELVQ